MWIWRRRDGLSYTFVSWGKFNPIIEIVPNLPVCGFHFLLFEASTTELKIYTQRPSGPDKTSKKSSWNTVNSVLRFRLKFLFGSKGNSFRSHLPLFKWKRKSTEHPRVRRLNCFPGLKRHGFRSHENGIERRTLTVNAGKETLLTGNVSYGRVLGGWGDRRQTQKAVYAYQNRTLDFFCLVFT